MRAIPNVFVTAAVALGTGLLCSACSTAKNDSPKAEDLLVFIGQKVRVVEQKLPTCDKCIVFDSHYVANYRVLETVYGNYGGDKITFDVYDHYGVPAFSRYDTVLLFIVRQPDGPWTHVKYQFYDLYKGVDGQWYGCGDPYGGVPHPHGTVRARPVQFAAPVFYPLDDLSTKEINRRYPPEYFELRDGRAYCLMGAPVADLYRAKKETVLAARGIFK